MKLRLYKARIGILGSDWALRKAEKLTRKRNQNILWETRSLPRNIFDFFIKSLISNPWKLKDVSKNLDKLSKLSSQFVLKNHKVQ